MGDSWDDEEFDVPTLAPSGPTSWEDEDEVDEESAPVHGLKPQLSMAKAKKLQHEAAAAKLARLDAMLDENESPEDRKLRERRMIEEGDHALTDELFSGVTSEETVVKDPNAVTMPLKDLKDHLHLVVTLNEKMAASKQNHVVMFTKEFLKTNSEERFEVADLSEMINILTTAKNTKEEKMKKPTAKAKTGKAAKKTKKEVLAEKKKHDDLFGDNDRNGEYDAYEDQFDDFF